MTITKFLKARNNCCNHYETNCFKCPLDDVAICDCDNTIFTDNDDKVIKRAEKILKEFDYD